MKTLRKALAQCLYTSAAAWAEPLLSDALDELEALRVAAGPAGDIISGVLEERLAAVTAQRDELLAALAGALAVAKAHSAGKFVHPEFEAAVVERGAEAIAKSRGGA